MTTTETKTDVRYRDPRLAEAIRAYVFDGVLPLGDARLAEDVLRAVCAPESDAER